MTKLRYVGFNGYFTNPVSSSAPSKIISNWMESDIEDLINISCAHRVLTLENNNDICIYGTINTENKNTYLVKKPVKFNTLCINDNYIISCEKTNIYKFQYKLFVWEKINLNFLNKKEECTWSEEGNEIIKCVFMKNDVILLMSNGSVWKLVENFLTVLHIQDVERAVDICTGFEHCLILTESGCVLSCGSGSRGQLGHGDLNSTTEPVQISALEGLKVVKISAGGWHSCAITDSGDLCVWGWNNYGQLSLTNQDEDAGLSALPEFVDVGPDPDIKVVDVACGNRHTIAKLENGDLYSTGWNGYRQLGIESSEEKIWRFTKCTAKLQKGRIVCGSWYTILIEEV